jgi:four helix bundle protein
VKKVKKATLNAERRTSNAEYPPLGESENDRWQLRDGNSDGKKYDLEERLLEFASAIIDLSEKLPPSRAGNHVAGQILRSGTSPYPNHGEAESAESRDDFIHKLKICLKELRETRRWAQLIHRKRWAHENPTLLFILGESDTTVL